MIAALFMITLVVVVKVDAQNQARLGKKKIKLEGKGSRLSPLVCLVHVANNLCKALGLAYPPQEKPA